MHNSNSHSHIVNVRLSEPLTSLDQAHKVVDSVLNSVGCAGCLSGYDIHFSHIRDMVVNPKTLQVQELGR